VQRRRKKGITSGGVQLLAKRRKKKPWTTRVNGGILPLRIKFATFGRWERGVRREWCRENFRKGRGPGATTGKFIGWGGSQGVLALGKQANEDP